MVFCKALSLDQGLAHKVIIHHKTTTNVGDHGFGDRITLAFVKHQGPQISFVNREPQTVRTKPRRFHFTMVQ